MNGDERIKAMLKRHWSTLMLAIIIAVVSKRDGIATNLRVSETRPDLREGLNLDLQVLSLNAHRTSQYFHFCFIVDTYWELNRHPSKRPATSPWKQLQGARSITIIIVTSQSCWHGRYSRSGFLFPYQWREYGQG